MTPAQVSELLANQSKARERRRVAVPVESRAQVTVKVALPPSWNRMFLARAIPGPKGRAVAMVYKSAEAKKYAEHVGAYCRAHGISPYPALQMLSVSITVRMERAGCDIENRLKSFFDALQGHVYENDNQVAEYSRVARVVDSENPGITAVFTPLAVDAYGQPLKENS